MAKSIVVDVAAQTVTAYLDSAVVHTFECVSGDAAHPTPQGRFAILRKHRYYTSRAYGVPMNYAMFFTSTGEALHQYHGPVPWSVLRLGRRFTNEVGSHGCVRMQENDARTLYEWATVGTVVMVLREACPVLDLPARQRRSTGRRAH